jgi:hypothetical protein
MQTLEEYLSSMVTNELDYIAAYELIDDKHELFKVLANELEGEAELRFSLSEMGYEIVEAKTNQDNLTLQLQRGMSS